MKIVLLLAVLVATAAKLYCAATTTGTNDVHLFYMFGRFISESGLAPLYGATRMFNHTPLIGTATSVIYDLASDDLKRFAFFLRLPGILADLGSVLLILRIRQTTGQPPWWALTLFALSPVSFMVSGFHGNVDSIMVFLLVLVALMCIENQPHFCGLCLGLACNVKVVPLLLVPALFFFWMHRRKALPFAVAAIATVLIGWALPLIITPRAFLTNVLGYSSYWGSWGITYWLNQAPWKVFHAGSFIGLTPVQDWVIRGLKLVIIGGALAIAWRRRSGSALQLYSTIALTWAVFFVFASGVGGQYLVWIGPFLLMFSARAYAAFTAAASVALFIFYNTIAHGMPWDTAISTNALAPVWQPWMTLPWLTLVGVLVLGGRELFRIPPEKVERVS